MLGKKAAVKVFEPLQQRFRGITAIESAAGQVENFGGAEPEPQHVIQVEVMQFIGADQLFGLLGDGAVLGTGQAVQG